MLCNEFSAAQRLNTHRRVPWHGFVAVVDVCVCVCDGAQSVGLRGRQHLRWHVQRGHHRCTDTEHKSLCMYIA